jgi:phage gp29-like protein
MSEVQSSSIKGLSYLQDFQIKQLPNPDWVLSRTNKNYKAFRDLKADPHVWSSIQQRKSGVLGLETTLEIEDKIFEKQVEQMLARLNIDQLIRDILEAPLFGFQPIEIIWQLINGRLEPVELITQKQEYFVFNSDGDLQYYSTGSSDPVKVPPNKILLPRYEANKINPYGQSLLSKCYWVVQFKSGTTRNWMSFADKYGSPILLGQYTRGATKEEITSLAEELANMTDDQVIVAPTDISLDMHEAKMTTSKELFNGLINYCNTEISKAILSQTLTTELNIGSFAAANIHYKIKREVVEGDIRIVEDTINQLIEYYINLNFRPTDKPPKFKIVFTNQDNKDRIELFDKLTKMGFEFDEIMLEKEFGINPDFIKKNKRSLKNPKNEEN